MAKRKREKPSAGPCGRTVYPEKIVQKMKVAVYFCPECDGFHLWSDRGK